MSTPDSRARRTPREMVAGTSRELLGGKVKVYFLDSQNPLELENKDERSELLCECLDFELPKFYRSNGVLVGERGTETKMRANCNTATGEFGKQLAQEDNEGESFFTQFPDAKYFDVRSKPPFKKNYGEFHSIGMIAIPQADKKGYMFVGVDLTNNATNPEETTRTAIFYGEDESEVCQALKEYYGGAKWRADYVLMPETDNKQTKGKQPYKFITSKTMTQVMDMFSGR